MRGCVWCLVLGVLAWGCDDPGRRGAEGDGRVVDARAVDRGSAEVGVDVGPADAAVADGAPDVGVDVDAAGAADAAPDAAVDADRGADAALDAEPIPDAAPDAAPDAGPPPLAPLMTEFVARNDTGLVDDQGRTSDWIELYNPHTEPIDLGRFGLSDADDAGDVWWLPARALPPGGYVVVFASGDDVAGVEGPLHAAFRIDAAGEPLSLVGPDGAVLQRFEAAPRAPDVAYGLPATALVEAGAMARYRPPAAPDGWTGPDFDDGGWSEGPTGIGRDEGGPPSALDPWADALLSHWSFDATRLDDDGATLALDARPGGPPVRLERAARLVDGRVGQALTGGLGRVLGAEVFDFSRDFTWALWMAGDDPSGALISRNAPGIAWSRGAKALFVRQGVLRFDAGWVGAPRTRTFVNQGAWHHVAAAYRAADDRFTIYIDGAPRYDQPFDVNAFPEDLDDPPVRAGLFLGQADFTGGLPDLGPYDGRIDEVSIWNAALPAEAVGHMVDGAAPPSRGPFEGLIATAMPEADGVQLRSAFEAGDGLAAAALRLYVDDGFAAWVDGAPVAALAGGARDDGLAVLPLDVAVPLPAPGAHVLAVEAGSDPADRARWVVRPELWALEAAPAALVRPTPGALNSRGRAPAVAIDPPEGLVSAGLRVQIAVVEPDDGRAVVHYTVDGSRPDADAPVYAGPFALDGPATVRAVALAPSRAPGPEASARFAALTAELEAFESTIAVMVVDRGGAGLPVRGAYGDALLAAWTPGDDGITRLADPPALVSRAAIKVRGQSSSGAPKAPYRLELRDADGRDRAEPLLGLPAEADWVLHGPYWDKSLIRNALVYGLGREMGLAAPRTVPFELYLRGADGRVAPEDARGVYVLVERIELGPDRLDLPAIGPDDEAPPAVTGGWVLKFEAGVAEAPLVPGWQNLEVVEPSDPTPAQLAWVQGAVAELDDALEAPDFLAPDARWRARVDVDSAIDHLIVNELFRDQDAYARSTYLHMDREGPWVMGPLWDYNLVAGVGGFFDNTSTTGWQYRVPYNAGEHGWWVRMMADPAFAAAVGARWRALRAGLLSDEAIAARVAGLTAALAEPAARNFAIWPNLGSARVAPFVTPASATWGEQVELLLGWLTDRAAWIDGQLVGP